jgi:hypothetical protein
VGPETQHDEAPAPTVEELKTWSEEPEPKPPEPFLIEILSIYDPISHVGIKVIKN